MKTNSNKEFFETRTQLVEASRRAVRAMHAAIDRPIPGSSAQIDAAIQNLSNAYQAIWDFDAANP